MQATRGVADEVGGKRWCPRGMGMHTGDSEESWASGGGEDMLRKDGGLGQGEMEREQLTTRGKR